jgi:hypothetical protein
VLKQPDEDKIKVLDEHKLMAMAGENASRVQFGEYIHKNILYKKHKNSWTLSLPETANYVR